MEMYFYVSFIICMLYCLPCSPCCAGVYGSSCFSTRLQALAHNRETLSAWEEKSP